LRLLSFGEPSLVLFKLQLVFQFLQDIDRKI